MTVNQPVQDDGALAHSRLEHYPVTLFAIVMGLAGFSLSLRAAEHTLGLDPLASRAALLVTVAVFIGLAAGYVLKSLRHPGAVAAEWGHPVKLAFFPTVPISLLLLAAASFETLPVAAHLLWITGAALQLVMTLAVITGWIGHRPFLPAQLSPAWFIPAVGNVIVPVAGVPLGYVEASWFFFSMGMVFWLVLLTLVFNRLVFHDPLPGRLQPTLVILIAPPALGFIAWLRLNGEVDAFARILLNTGYVFALVVAIQVPRLLRLPFALSFWALSFPVAGLTIASLHYGDIAASPLHRGIGLGLLILLAAVIVILVPRTLGAAARGEICRPE